MAIMNDVLIPTALVIPVMSGTAGTQPTMTGSIFMSGAKLYFYNGSAIALITSA